MIVIQLSAATMISRWRSFVLFALVFLIILFSNRSSFKRGLDYGKVPLPANYDKSTSPWTNVPQEFPVSSMTAVPTSAPNSIPRIQHDFGKESSADKRVRIQRLNAVKGNFTHAWQGYKDHAWLKDEVKPLSGGSQDPFGGWAATLVDSLGP
jgi:mannosyl-oligosaccharide alpha-1,2-mannosidase